MTQYHHSRKLNRLDKFQYYTVDKKNTPMGTNSCNCSDWFNEHFNEIIKLIYGEPEHEHEHEHEHEQPFFTHTQFIEGKHSVFIF